MRMFKRMLAMVLCVAMVVSAAMVGVPVGAANAEKQKELFYLLTNINSYSQSIGGVINEYQTTGKFKLSKFYSAIDIGSDSKNFWQTVIFLDNSGAVERKNEDIYKVERKILLDVLTSVDPDIKLDDSGTLEQLKRIQKTMDKLTGVEYLTLFSEKEITKEEENAFKEALKYVLPEMKSLFPNVDNETWGKLVKDWNAIDLAGAAIDGVSAVEKLFCAIAITDAELETIDNLMKQIPSNSDLYTRLNSIKSEIKSNWTENYWNEYLKDKTINVAIKTLIKKSKEIAENFGWIKTSKSIGIVSNTLSWASFLNKAIFNWVLNTPSIDDYCATINLWGHVNTIYETMSGTINKCARGIASSDELEQLSTNLTIHTKLLNKTLELAKGFAGSNKTYGITYIDDIILKNTENTNKILELLCEDSNGSNVANGVYYIASAIDNTMVFDIENSSKSSKANLQLFHLNGGDNQKFSITKNNGYYSITNINSNKSVDVSGGYTTSKTNVWQYDANASKAQQWIFVDAGNGYYYIKSALGTYIDAKDGKAFDGNNIWMYGYNGTVAQQWKLIPVDSIKLSELQCNHSWNYGCEYKHPHRDYKICSKCGEKEYTNNGSYNSSCSECNPACSHTWGYGCENAHPHRDYKICQKCGEKEYITDGKYDSSCAKCNPTCNHAWSTGNDSAHPHNEYRVCTKCGEKSYTGKTGYSSSCSTCTYTPSWGSWSDWSTASVSESSTRQVETKTQYVYYHYHLTYDDNNVGNYPINMATANENFKNLANAHVKAEAYHEYYSDSPLTLCSGRLVYLVNGKSVIWDKYVNKCSEDTGSYDGNANFLYYKGTRTLYRYRDYK